MRTGLSRLLIICPLADIYSGIGNFGAPPLGPWRLAFYLRNNGQHVDVWDCNVSENLRLPSPNESIGRDRAEVLAESFVEGISADFDLSTYDFIGFSVLSDTLPSTLGVIELLHKQNLKAKLIGGNHEATVNLQDCIGKSHLDGVILADAEEPMLALMQGIEPSKIPGVLWRTHNPKPPRERFEEWNSGIRWDEIPYESYWKRTTSLYPDFDKMDPEEKLSKLYEINTVRIHSLVACELACTYSVSGDTVVFTDDGPVEISRLAHGIGSVRACIHGVPVTDYRISTSVATPGGRGIATHAVDEGVQPVIRITTEGGFSIKTTAEHRLLCAENDDVIWRRADALTIGDFVVVRRPEHVWPLQYRMLQAPVLLKKNYAHRGANAPEHRLPTELDEKLAWLSGYIVGDGCIPADGRPAFTFIVSPDLERRQREIIHDVFGLELKVTKFGHTDKVRSGWVYSRLAREVFVQSLGIDPSNKLKIPEIFWRSPRSVLSAFIDGLFDADGHTSKRRGDREVTLTTISERLARDVSYAILMLGRGCPNIQHINKNPNTTQRDHYRVSVFQGERIPSTRSIYKSRYSGMSYWRTHQRGSIGIRRSSIRKAGLHHPLDRDGWYYMRVREITALAAEQIYDITVPEGEAFVANGFVAHNCSVANTRRIASGSNKPSIVNLSPAALGQTLLAVKKQVPRVMTIYDSSDEAWLGRGRAEEYLGILESIRTAMDAGLPRGMRYLIQCRTNDLTEELIVRAGKVGVRHLTIGIESPVAQVRKDIKKPQGEDLIRNVIRWGTASNVEIYGLFIMFLPSITLEQLHEAVENWRIYMELGATISVEPFCMAYLGTALADDTRYITEHAGYEIPFSGGKKLKWATLIWPGDRRVCAVLQWFRENIDAFIEAARQKLGHKHTFKGTTGKITVDCLETALNLYNAGKISPWEPGNEGKRSMVYQDYGDQMSGSEIAAAAANMDRKNTTATRFNSTHSLLDDTNAGVKGRIKDPALPHEMLIPFGKKEL